jgi:hypothetical protein
MREAIFKTSKNILMAVGIIQLALSQIHIEMITKLFARDVGFYLFLFIIGGLLIVFNLSSMTVNNAGKIKQFIATVIIAFGSGIWFIVLTWKDYLAKDSVTISDIKMSLILVAIGSAVYLIGSIVTLGTYFMNSEKA